VAVGRHQLYTIEPRLLALPGGSAVLRLRMQRDSARTPARDAGEEVLDENPVEGPIDDDD